MQTTLRTSSSILASYQFMMTSGLTRLEKIRSITNFNASRCNKWNINYQLSISQWCRLPW